MLFVAQHQQHDRTEQYNTYKDTHASLSCNRIPSSNFKSHPLATFRSFFQGLTSLSQVLLTSALTMATIPSEYSQIGQNRMSMESILTIISIMVMVIVPVVGIAIKMLILPRVRNRAPQA
ncbi:hypothetical protein CC86DRAFT_466608 [Ophiobolus disseminans]|uniref:Uncharacterized protein n=1 Tax=Ophiobolus disseminans TaxID=1469910 RepID=A0A6A7A1W7_9PLEO|nr:hypothetical protein CC86DRAFT_466608 [Ophiobolus disseminans]